LNFIFVILVQTSYTELMVLPLQFLKFWFLDAPRNLIVIIISFNQAFLQLTSLTLFIKTFFKPWKNEYREGLVGFSIGMGMFIKTMFIIADTFLLLIFLILEILLVGGFIIWPIATIFLYKEPILFILSVICILNIFFLFRPKKTWIDTVSGKSTLQIVKELLSRKDVMFVLRKAEIDKSEIQLIDVQREQLFNNTESQTPFDILESYLLSTEEKTKLLFNKEIKKEDLESIIAWGKNLFPQEKKPFRFNFWGEGMGESWVHGWTYETSKYMVDTTSEAVNCKPMIVGRIIERKQAIEALGRNRSCLLVGEPGSGRGTFVRALANESYNGELKGNLYHQRFFELMIDALLAGTQNQGDLEGRLKDFITEISHSESVVIYIPSFENILGASTFNTDLSGAIVPYLQKEKIRIIANITPASYKRFVEPHHTLADLFESIKFEEPPREVALKMLLQKSSEIERVRKITVSYKAITEAVNLADKYLQGKVMPGTAVTLLEDAAAAVCNKCKKNVERQDIIERVEEKTKIAVGKPKEEEKELLLNLEKELHKRIIGQNEAISQVSEALRRLRAGLSNPKKPISFLFLGPTGVGKTETAKALSSIYYGSESEMIRFDMSEYSTDESVERFLGGIAGSRGMTDAVFDNPCSLILLDEFEKSNQKIRDLFLQILDDGRLSDNKGKTVSFADNIIIATSNAGSEYIREEVGKGKAVDKIFQKSLLEVLQEKGIFRPEFLNRFDGIIVFEPLKEEEVLQIVKMLLVGLSKKLEEKDIDVNFDDKIVGKIAGEGFDKQFGARPLKRFIQNSIEDLLAQKILREEIKRGDKVVLSTNDVNEITIVVS
jgi:ATP-dependent Clp protease ATP-binding subunit ClpC